MDREQVKPGRKVKITAGDWQGQTGKVMGSPTEWSTHKWMVSVRLTKPGRGIWDSVVSIEVDYLECA